MIGMQYRIVRIYIIEDNINYILLFYNYFSKRVTEPSIRRIIVISIIQLSNIKSRVVINIYVVNGNVHTHSNVR